MFAQTLSPFRLVLILFALCTIIHALPAPYPGRTRTKPIPDKRPSPGHSGVHYDSKHKVIHVNYGSDVPGHRKHVDDWGKKNFKKYPGLKQMHFGPSGSKVNRKNALKGIKTKKGYHRDEKPPNSMKNPHAAHKTTSVRLLPEHESRKEGALLSKARAVHNAVHKQHGIKAKVQLNANYKHAKKARAAGKKSGIRSSRRIAGKPPKAYVAPRKSGRIAAAAKKKSKH